jgi:hypothetical protein
MKSGSASERIRVLGFRRWYERQLIEGHLWLVSCFVAMIAVAAGMELLTLEGGVREFLADASLIVAGCVAGWVSWRRYAWTMLRAEAIGEQAVCGGCQHYGFRFCGLEGARMRARCPKCSHEWLIDEPPPAAFR